MAGPSKRTKDRNRDPQPFIVHCRQAMEDPQNQPLNRLTEEGTTRSLAALALTKKFSFRWKFPSY